MPKKEQRLNQQIPPKSKICTFTHFFYTGTACGAQALPVVPVTNVRYAERRGLDGGKEAQGRPPGDIW